MLVAALADPSDVVVWVRNSVVAWSAGLVWAHGLAAAELVDSTCCRGGPAVERLAVGLEALLAVVAGVGTEHFAYRVRN